MVIRESGQGTRIPFKSLWHSKQAFPHIWLIFEQRTLQQPDPGVGEGGELVPSQFSEEIGILISDTFYGTKATRMENPDTQPLWEFLSTRFEISFIYARIYPTTYAPLETIV